MPKYVALEGIKEGNKFYTAYTEGEDPTRLYDGTVAYKVLGFADTDTESQKLLGYGIDPEHDREVLASYLFRTGRGFFSKEACDQLSHLLT
jgi:hypothetical protein